MGGKFAHELTELTALADSDILVIEDADAPTVLKQVSVQTLKSLFGTGGAVEPEEYVESESVSNPTWATEGIAGGWRVRITSVIADAQWYCVQRYNVETEDYDDVHSFTASLQTTGSQVILAKDFEASDITVPEYAVFRIITINTSFEKSAASGTSGVWSLRSVAPSWTPAAPTLLTVGGYPEVIQTADRKFLIKVKIQAASGERQYVDGYRVRIRQWDSEEAAYDEWNLLPFHPVDPLSRPLIVYYEIGREHFKPGAKVEVAAAAKAIAPSGHLGTWSTAQEVDPSTDVTALDTPVVTSVLLSMGAFCFLAEPKRDSVVAVDLDYWLLQYRLDGGDATNIPPDGKLYDKAYKLEVTRANIAKTIEFRAKAYDYAGNASAYSAWTTAVTPEKIQKEALSITKLQDITATPGLITTGAGGGTNAFRTAATGARVEMPDLTDSNRGLTVWDDAAGRVFSVFNDGADVGDVIFGNPSGQHVKWDKSAAQLQITGLIAASGGLATAASGKRLHIYDVVANAVLSAFDVSNNETVILYPGDTAGYPVLKLCDGSNTNRAEMHRDTFVTWATSAFATIQISGTGHGELVLRNSAGNSNAAMDSAGEGYVNLGSSGAYKLGGVQIVGAQEAHIVDADGTIGDITTKFNTLLAALDADAGHGLLAGAP